MVFTIIMIYRLLIVPNTTIVHIHIQNTCREPILNLILQLSKHRLQGMQQ